jgi:tetratricopeptide (TPR) repeat protein
VYPSLRTKAQPDLFPTGESLWSDSEITQVDDDQFGYRDYASVLAGLARRAGTPLVIGIFGAWGSGKSSLMRMIQENLRLRSTQSSVIQTIWLNVWQLSNQEELWNAFLQALLTTVHEKMPLYRRWMFDLGLLLRRVRWGELLRQILFNTYRILIVIIPILITALLPESIPREPNRLFAFLLDPLTGGAASLILGLWLLVKPAVEAAKDVVSLDLGKALKEAPYEVRVSTLQNMQQHFTELVHVWVGKEGRLVVFVDDLDRCTPDKAPEVLEALKLFTTTSGCIYVLGMDYTMLLQGIAIRYKFDEEEASAYLEKIIQIPFHLPPLEDNRITDFVRKAYPTLVEKCTSLPEIFSIGLEPNPRKVKRALNIYRTLLALAEYRQITWEIESVNMELLAKMVIIQSRFPRLFDYLVHDSEFLTKLDVFEQTSETWDKLLSADIRSIMLDGVSKDGKHIGLVDGEDLNRLMNMLNTGNARFNQLEKSSPMQADLFTYIYLTGTARSPTEHLRPKREDREVLLNADHEIVHSAVESLLKRGEEEGDKNRYFPVYRPKLMTVIENPEGYQPSERSSANWALVYFDLELGSDPEQAYKQGIERDKNEIQLYKMLIELYKKQNRFREVNESISSALAIDPQDFELKALAEELKRPAPLQSRRLTEVEINEARLVFAEGLDYSRIFLVENARFPSMIESFGRRLKGLPPAPIQTALTLGGKCYFTTNLHTSIEQISQGDIAEMAWLIHELTHAWQYQRFGWRYLIKTLRYQFIMGPSAYDYGSAESLVSRQKSGFHLHDFNPEQQGDIARDYYLRVKKNLDISAWQPFIEEFQQAV